MSAQLFQEFRKNLSVRNSESISKSYQDITESLNIQYYNSNSTTQHCRQVGSYGRHTAVDGLSDLDMAFILPDIVYERFNRYAGNKQSALLAEIRLILKERFPNREVRTQQQIVSVEFTNYIVEVLPVFILDDGSYRYPDANDGGNWRTCNPIAEIDAVNSLNIEKNHALKRLCKMVRAWKNEHGVAMQGMLIDTLCYGFLKQTNEYNTSTYGDYKNLVKDFFAYLVNQDETQGHWRAPGSNSWVYKTGNFHPKAKKALRRCQEALDDNEIAHERWASNFGSHFPPSYDITKQNLLIEYNARDSEEFITDKFPLDIRYNIQVNCQINNHGDSLRNLLARANFFIPKERTLSFHITDCNVPPPFKIYWKVKNSGAEAFKRNMIRGLIQIDSGNQKRIEKSNFSGDHYVECYAIKNNICVARSRIKVPIEQ